MATPKRITVKAIGPVYLVVDIGGITESRVWGMVRFLLKLDGITEAKDEVVNFEFDRKKYRLQVLLPMLWETQGNEKALTAVAGEVALKVLEFLRTQIPIEADSEIALAIGFH